jgi:hypothetical protein
MSTRQSPLGAGLSATVTHLGLQARRVRQDRSCVGPVMVNFGGQQSRTGLFVPKPNLWAAILG